jgi:hypothetical protein
VDAGGANDAHCHFFSTPFFAALGGEAALATLGGPPGAAEALADGPPARPASRLAPH